MTTLNDNYKKNVAILKENIKRGLSYQQATTAINGMEKQFINANLYNDEAKMYIKTMNSIVTENYTTTISASDAMKALGVEVVRIA